MVSPTVSLLSSPPKAGASSPPKPLLRGVSHQVSFFCTIAAGAALVVGARPGTATAAAFVFALALANLFGTSALYHRIDWSPEVRRRVRRLDHAAIFVLIAGGYTPLFALVPSSAGGHGALAAIWVGSILGVLKSLVWPDAPKWMTALLCVALGWTVVGQVLDRVSVVGSLSVGLLVASGVIYSIGALVYALKRPDPLPRVFGYHEVFHAFVVIASVCLFAHVVTVLRAT
jgi:hemolysin III